MISDYQINYQMNLGHMFLNPIICWVLVNNLLMFKRIAGAVLFLSVLSAHAVSSNLLNPDVMPSTIAETICTSGYTKDGATQHNLYQWHQEALDA